MDLGESVSKNVKYLSTCLSSKEVMFLVSLADLFVVSYYFWFVCLNCENTFLLHFSCVYFFLGGWSGLPFWCGTSYVLPIGEVIEA